MKEWITDRQPTKTDGDKNEDVRVHRRPGASEGQYELIHWSYVAIGAPWQHTSHWQPPAEPDRLAALEQRVAKLEATTRQLARVVPSNVIPAPFPPTGGN